MPEPDPADAVIGALAAAAGAAPRPVVLIDGRSGAGKSTIAARLAPALGAQLVHLEDMYPGWDGLEQASRHVLEHVLTADAPRWRRWDWQQDRPGEWQDVPPGTPLVVEGAGALSRANRRAATFAVWVELDDEERRRRALGRDGGLYAPHWDRWAGQEAAFIARERPAELADAVVRTDPWSLGFIFGNTGERRDGAPLA